MAAGYFSREHPIGRAVFITLKPAYVKNAATSRQERGLN